MKILFVHNTYQHEGGEDSVMAAEMRLVQAHGHSVVTYQRQNDELRSQGTLRTIAAGIETVWAARAFREMKDLISHEKPDVAHFHNTFPLISPAAYYACAQANIPMVQTLHNYRLLCPAATFMRDGQVCEACLGRTFAWPGVANGCYRGSRSTTAVVAAMVAGHRLIGTWREKVDLYIALSEFARTKFIEGGFPADRIFVKPNFVQPDPGPRQGTGEYALYLGRLSEEKGVRQMLVAWELLREAIPLRIAGEGPLKEEIAETIRAKGLRGIEQCGHLGPKDVVRLLRGAQFLVVPSEWYEGFPLVIGEAFACGVPVIASRLGSLAEIVTDGVHGLHFRAGDAEDLSAKVSWAWTHPEEMQAMGRNARAEYEAKYTGDRNYEKLLIVWNRLRVNSNS